MSTCPSRGTNASRTLMATSSGKPPGSALSSLRTVCLLTVCRLGVSMTRRPVSAWVCRKRPRISPEVPPPLSRMWRMMVSTKPFRIFRKRLNSMTTAAIRCPWEARTSSCSLVTITFSFPPSAAAFPLFAGGGRASCILASMLRTSCPEFISFPGPTPARRRASSSSCSSRESSGPRRRLRVRRSTLIPRSSMSARLRTSGISVSRSQEVSSRPTSCCSASMSSRRACRARDWRAVSALRTLAVPRFLGCPRFWLPPMRSAMLFRASPRPTLSISCSSRVGGTFPLGFDVPLGASSLTSGAPAMRSQAMMRQSSTQPAGSMGPGASTDCRSALSWGLYPHVTLVEGGAQRMLATLCHVSST
mmetsp:Transcript_1002/g.3858  ORF Transcript_1002/g.3858 Transcript_1002/m.3858 type:complete len:361 (-) Transcript_1002:645-1727(-)